MSNFFEDKDNETYHLTLDRESLNEVLTILSSKGKVDMFADKNGDVSFNIPDNTEINVQSINIPSIMMGVVEDVDKELATIEEGSEKYTELEYKRYAISFAAELTKSILNELKEINYDSELTEDEDEEEDDET